MKMAELKHNCCGIFLLLLAFLVFAGTVVLNFLAPTQIGRGILFLNDTELLERIYGVEIELIDWMSLVMWVTSYALQGLWLLYAMINICRKTPDGGSYLYVDPGLMPPAFYVLFILSCGCNLALLFLWDRGFFDYSMIPNGLNAFFLYLCLAVSCSRVEKKGKMMVKAGMAKDIWFTRLFVHNALGFYAAWASIFTLGHLATLLTHRFDIDAELSSTIALACLGFEALVYFILDTTVLDRYLRYTFTPYFAATLVLVGMILYSFTPLYRTTIMTVILLGGIGSLTIGKMMLAFWRCCVFPVFRSTDAYGISDDPEIKISSTD